MKATEDHQRSKKKFLDHLHSVGYLLLCR